MKKIELSIDSPLVDVFKVEEAKKIFDDIFIGMREKIEGQDALKGMNIRKLVAYSKGNLSKDYLSEINEKLNKIQHWEVEEKNEYSKDTPILKEACEKILEKKRQAFYPGLVWRDTEGVRIQAHGGSILYDDGTYYWYGENKNRTNGKNSIWTWGISAYQSRDLYNWTYVGLIIEPDLVNRSSGLYPESHSDRPHIIKCKSTNKYICWIKQSDLEACFLILESDAFTGPYYIVNENYCPFHKKVGDFDIFVEDEKAYLFADLDHQGIIGMELTDNYHEVKNEVSRQYMRLNPPFCREGVSLFKHESIYYMITSGMSGYIPNKSDAASTTSLVLPFEPIGCPHVEDRSNSSFNSQISSIFKVPYRNLYIAIADRWVPEYIVDEKKADIIQRSIASHYEPERYVVTKEEQKELMNSPMLGSANTSIADYVWLPLTIEDGVPKIVWKDEWRIEDYQ